MPGELSLQEEIDRIVARYEPQIKAIEDESRKIQDDFETPSDAGVAIGVDFDVSWEKTDVKIDIPSVRMKYRKMSLDIPEVSMKTRRIVFDTPSVRMVTKVVGKYPCFKGIKIYSCDAKMDVPEFFMERHEIKMDIPEFSMKRIEIKMDMPEFFMERKEWSLHLPQFKIINVKGSINEMKDKADSLRQRGEAIAIAMQSEISAVMAGGLGSNASAINAERAKISASFDAAIFSASDAINSLVSKKVDPIKVPADGGEINLRKHLDSLIADKEKALADFDSNVSPTEGAFIPSAEMV